jgi:hypothetical protein
MANTTLSDLYITSIDIKIKARHGHTGIAMFSMENALK